MSKASLQKLAEVEPWRLGKGQPKNALDPTWLPSRRDKPCDGDIEWEGSTGWWTCTKCGYVGRSSYQRHKPIETPECYLVHSLLFYLVKRMKNPPDVAAGNVLTRILKQLLFTAGVALRYSATQRPEDLGKYVDRLVID